MSGESNTRTLCRTLQQVEAIAQGKGLVVREARARELLIDIDSEPALTAFHRLIAAFRAHESAVYSWALSPSGEPGHYHVTVTLDRELVDETERILLQVLLGSDPMRELLAWRRLQLGCELRSISVFFERPTA